MVEHESPRENPRQEQGKGRQRRAVGDDQPRDREIEHRDENQRRTDRLEQPDENLARRAYDREVVQIVVIEAQHAQRADD